MRQIICTFLMNPLLHRLTMFLGMGVVRTGMGRSPQSGYTGERAYGGMSGFVINVDECSLHIGKDLDGILKLLANIVRFPQRCACIHDDVDLNEVVRAALAHRIL